MLTEQTDVDTAYLNADLDIQNYMLTPEGYDIVDTNKVLNCYTAQNIPTPLLCAAKQEALYQTPNNIALPLHWENVKILGTSPEMIDNTENRYKFSRMCNKVGVDQPLWKELTSIDEEYTYCDKTSKTISTWLLMLLESTQWSSRSTLRMLKIEMDAVAVKGKLVMHVVSEHAENAGVHSGDATLVLPPQDLDPETVRKIEITTAKVANALNATGPLNIQFIAKNNEI
ncbi:hypothetical protein HDU84_006325 [Entophlyctis sp. JEL0112]|nr:hypothetical protein HDU84_006325 [Entophlyctis sp. JEL0112]